MRRLLCASIAMLVLMSAAAFGTIYLLTPTPGVTLDNAHRLHQGMRLSQVEELMGRTPDSTGDDAWGSSIAYWKSDEFVVAILYTRNDSIVYSGYVYRPNVPRSAQPIAEDHSWWHPILSRFR